MYRCKPCLRSGYGKLAAVSEQRRTVSVCGCLGQLSAVGPELADAEGCFVWRTDAQLLKRSGHPERGSLLELACDVAELYHHKHELRLADLPDEPLEVIWLELAADGSLLVFLKPPLTSGPAPTRFAPEAV